MNMLRALQLMKEDIKNKEMIFRRAFSNHFLFKEYGRPIRGRVIHLYGMPDCGKTFILRGIIESSYDESFIYISKNKDNIYKMKYKNCSILMSNVFEETIDYLSKLDKDCVDYVLIDDIHSMISRAEADTLFTKRLDTHDLFNNYIRKLSEIAAQKNFVLILTNSINLISKKSRYGFMIDKEAVASFEIKRTKITDLEICLKIIPTKNLLSDDKEIKNFTINRRNCIWRANGDI